MLASLDIHVRSFTWQLLMTLATQQQPDQAVEALVAEFSLWLVALHNHNDSDVAWIYWQEAYA